MGNGNGNSNVVVRGEVRVVTESKHKPRLGAGGLVGMAPAPMDLICMLFMICIDP
jgi:hypothetical protein